METIANLQYGLGREMLPELPASFVVKSQHNIVEALSRLCVLADHTLLLAMSSGSRPLAHALCLSGAVSLRASKKVEHVFNRRALQSS